MTNEVSRRGMFAVVGGASALAAIPMSAMALPSVLQAPSTGTVDATVLWWNGRLGHVRGDDGRRYSIDRSALASCEELNAGQRLRLTVRAVDSHSVTAAEVL